MSQELEKKIEQLQSMIDRSKRIVFFGGAGVSTESGIPDFRSIDGLYNAKDPVFNRPDPEWYLSDECLFDYPKIFFQFYRKKMDMRECQPNVTHYKLAELEQAGKLSLVITQNIDGLHQKAGSQKVAEIHGTTLRAYCPRCKKEYDYNLLYDSEELLVKCPTPGCNYPMLRPDVTLYGEGLPEAAWELSARELAKADLMIIAGTSLTVYPAANLIRYYGGDDIVLINRDRTPYDRYASLVINDVKMGEVFSRIKV